ncbi:unnamed protein product [Didymodactylos carnosus]|uniref:C2 domain-containing protein n=1 Tax=Didymodactylos carnosus TaxID=1234261 RepID=A0A813TD17_9BILA|nr:unnamed protein product [Didymodactylos carnosus]CAF3594621.1 unnamed protein product [Didymodactylos carnosus]
MRTERCARKNCAQPIFRTVFWREQQQILPILAKIAKSIYVIQASSAESERHFSTSGQIVTEQRSQLDPECTSQNLIMPQLEVKIIEARNLKQQDTFSNNDAFVEAYLDPHYKQKTKTKKNTNKPQWNETLVFNHQYGQDTLFLDVYDEDLVKNDVIGKITINLKSIYEKGHLDEWIKLPSKSGVSSSHGEIHIILNYQDFEQQNSYL